MPDFNPAEFARRADKLVIDAFGEMADYLLGTDPAVVRADLARFTAEVSVSAEQAAANLAANFKGGDRA